MEKPNNEKDQLPEEEINPGDDGVPEGGSISEDNHKPVVDGNANDKPPEDVENEKPSRHPLDTLQRASRNMLHAK